MVDTCVHLDTIRDVTPSSEGCDDCLRIGGRWAQLRRCIATVRGHDNRHDPIIRSYEPAVDRWCDEDDLAFEVECAPPAPSQA